MKNKLYEMAKRECYVRNTCASIFEGKHCPFFDGSSEGSLCKMPFSPGEDKTTEQLEITYKWLLKWNVKRKLDQI